MKELSDLHKYLVSNKLIESSSKDSDEGYLHEGNWFKNLSDEFAISSELFMKFCIDIYHGWESESQNKLCQLFDKKYSDDKEFIKYYLNESCLCNELFCRASERLQSDYELLKLYADFVYPEGGYASIIYLNKNVQNNRELMLRLVADVHIIFQDLNEEFRDDEEFVAIAIKNNGVFLKYASKKIRDNEKLVTLAIKNNIKAVLYASKRLRECPDGKFYEQYWHVINDVEFKQ